ncbi:hypothetical protein PHYBOEH_008479 [Phytophthora boehmeriae]|uniref:Calcineurin-like phosphoesterase domain-containing protein n=1 Tax=Phytophthora boehmeriae TaxID=109152 RepID=A0A8T1XCD7_9STRA|nr:hypothetical protein PHYBOEH_008479 [Phytophthora boehmeriae]
MKSFALVSASFASVLLSSHAWVATTDDNFRFRSTAWVSLEAKATSAGSDLVSAIICESTEATALLGFQCGTKSTSASTTTPTTTATVSRSVTYDLHALAIGDWGVDLGLGSCCNVYRKTGVGNKEYYKDQQAQPNVAYLLALSAKKLQPKAILGHGDNFYWNGLGSDDVSYRFLNSFESMYSDPALLSIPWFNVAGNHDLGGSMFICGKRDNQFVECSGTTELLKNLDEKFTRQSTYVSPNNDRWKMPSRYYVERLENLSTGVSVDVFNIDTNAATVHGAHQTCCQCYGYKMKYGGAQSCSDVARGDTLCAGGDTQMFDACVSQIEAWQADSLHQLARDAAASTATWKVVNTHYSPHFHMDPTMMAEVNSILSTGGIHLYMNGHTHAESHEFGSFNTHFVTNGAGGGIQSESIGEPPPYATQVKSLWRGENSPYGIFELSFAANQMKMQFVTFDDNWVFASNKADTVKGGAKMGHCWLIPKDGSLGEEC